jgi:hypothetical protein
MKFSRVCGVQRVIPKGGLTEGETKTDTTYHDNADVLKYVNPLVGTYGTTPNGNGGGSMYRLKVLLGEL